MIGSLRIQFAEHMLQMFTSSIELTMVDLQLCKLQFNQSEVGMLVMHGLRALQSFIRKAHLVPKSQLHCQGWFAIGIDFLGLLEIGHLLSKLGASIVAGS